MKKIILSILLALTTFSSALAQEDAVSKTVEVSRAYDPTLSFAYRINEMPVIDDTAKLLRTFEYTLRQAKPLTDNFLLTPIPPARVLPEKYDLDNKTHGLIRLGMGISLATLADVYVGGNVGRDFTWQVYGNHYGNYGKVKNAIGDKVENKNIWHDFGVAGKRTFKRAELSANVGFDQHWVHYYGYNPNRFTLAQYDALGDQFKKQRYNKFYANVGYHNVGFPDSTWLFGATFDFHDFRDEYSKVEDRFRFNAYGEKRILEFTKVGANILADISARTSDLAAHSNTVISIIPYIKETRENWEATAKLNLTLDNGASFKPYFYPTINFTYMLANRTFMPYVEISGHHEVNTYEGLAYENPYLSSQSPLEIENTKNKVSFIGGLKGRHRSSYSYNIWVSYSFIDDMYFYVNDYVWLSPSNLENSFLLAYSDAKVFSFNTELAIKPTKLLDINFTYNFNSYNLDNDQAPFEGAFHKALNRPKHNLLIQMRYNIWNKITCNLDFGLRGSYYARQGATVEPVKRGTGIDLSIGTEYKFFNSSSIFIQLNNITSSRYHVYNNYRTYGFNVVFGYMYAF